VLKKSKIKRAISSINSSKIVQYTSPSKPSPGIKTDLLESAGKSKEGLKISNGLETV